MEELRNGNGTKTTGTKVVHDTPGSTVSNDFNKFWWLKRARELNYVPLNFFIFSNDLIIYVFVVHIVGFHAIVIIKSDN